MSEKKELLKVLVIHGYRQSAKSSREKTGSFRKGLKKYLDLVYITAPNQISKGCPGKTRIDFTDEYGWWFSKQEMDGYSFSSRDNTQIDYGHDASLNLIRETFENEGPFDGILGFSQGATMAAHICALREEQDSPFKFHFAILCAGFLSKSTCHQKYYENKITIPALHVYGNTDQVIPKEMSVELKNLFTDNTILNHEGGHHLPATSSERKEYQKFLDRFRSSVGVMQA